MDYHHSPASQQHTGKASRIISILGGSVLLFHAVGRRDSILETIAGAYLLYRGISGNCPVSELAENLLRKQMNVNIRTSLRVRKPVGEVYSFWRQLDNLPLFMDHLKSVVVKSGTASEWKAEMPGAGSVSWNAVIVNEKENEVLGWSSVKDSSIYNAGKVEFRALAPHETEIDVTISYRAPMGTIGENIARVFTPALEKIVRKDIENFKKFMEAGFTESHRTDFRNELI